MLHKSFELLETKADGTTGEFTAIVSTFGNVDRVGDRILPGAWTKTLAKWEKSGDPIPIILAHQWDDPMAHIGIARPEDVKQVSKGLQVTGKLDVEDNPVAKQVHRLMQRRSLKEFSIGYGVPTGGEKRGKDGVNEISEIELAECGPCLKGIDPKTELQAVKSALAVAELPDATEQRDAAKKTEREVEQARVPKPLDTPPGPEVDFEAELAKVQGELAETKRLLEEATKPPPVDAKKQDEQATRAARELEEQKLPDVPTSEPAPQVDVGKELQEIKSQLAETRETLEALKKKADETDREPARARSVDPLRKQAEAEALEFASGGQNLRKPPKTAPPKPRKPALSLDELKQQTRDEMLGVLSGGFTG